MSKMKMADLRNRFKLECLWLPGGKLFLVVVVVGGEEGVNDDLDRVAAMLTLALWRHHAAVTLAMDEMRRRIAVKLGNIQSVGPKR